MAKSAKPLEYLSPTTTAHGALFNVDEIKESGPLMSGSLEIDDKKVPLSGFLKVAKDTGLRYLSLSLGEKDGVHYHGKLFRQEEQKRYATAPDYSGFLTVLGCTDAGQYTDEQWDAAPVLQVRGWRKRNADARSRIALTVAPTAVGDDELHF